MAQTKTGTETLWRFSVRLREGFLDAEAKGLLADIADLGVDGVDEVRVARVYYAQGALSAEQLKRLGEELLTDPITEEYEVAPLGYQVPKVLSVPGTKGGFGARYTIEVAYRPGVRDPVEDSLKKGAQDLGVASVQAVRTAKEFDLFGPVTPQGLQRVIEKLLVNATIQQVVTPEARARLFEAPAAGALPIDAVHLLQASDTVLQRVSLDHQLSLNMEEMRAIQAYFRKEGREPALIELETLAQTWSEHCKHKTLRGEVVYTEEVGGKTQKRVIRGLLKETIMKATQELAKPWCVSVFEDNSGVIGFDDQFHVCFKVETHNHPSALEPFGGANTGLGGVIRDILGTGLGAKPVASTDVFCFARPDFPAEEVPPGSLHPRRVIKGVVSGVRDYGNKMGIPTVNGAVLFDDRFVGNPLVYCGSVGLIPVDKVKKRVEPGQAVVVAGGRTGRDGVHGATFSSLTLTPESETVSSTAVQIGDPITEKKVTDALLEARDRGLFSAVTDCGAGGLSSAVGEMGAECGARVELEKVPLKYAGLTPAEIWISESQERMVLAVPQEKLAEILDLFRRRQVEAAAIGRFTGTKRLELLFRGARVGEMAMEFLHEGVPAVPRPARWAAPNLPEPSVPAPKDLTQELLRLLSAWDTCSKEWIIRRYDHEVQGGSVIKPIAAERGPSDAAVVRPRLDSAKGVVIANGINFRYGDLDPYWMAALAIDEAARQVVATGGTLDHLAILDNFCWGDPTRVEVLGSLVRAALGCCDAAKAYGTPFISGKDSLHNEYRLGEKTIQIPGTLLISAIGVIPDAAKAVSMDAKRAGNRLYIAGLTKGELGGSSWHALHSVEGGAVPQVDLEGAPKLLRRLSLAIGAGLVASAHDCSEGGLGVAAAEMAFAGGLGLALDLRSVPLGSAGATWHQTGNRYQVPNVGLVPGTDVADVGVLFCESATRLLLEVSPDKAEEFEKSMAGFPVERIGEFTPDGLFRVTGLDGKTVVEAKAEALRNAWEAPFKQW